MHELSDGHVDDKQPGGDVDDREMSDLFVNDRGKIDQDSMPGRGGEHTDVDGENGDWMMMGHTGEGGEVG